MVSPLGKTAFDSNRLPRKIAHKLTINMMYKLNNKIITDIGVADNRSRTLGFLCKNKIVAITVATNTKMASRLRTVRRFISVLYWLIRQSAIVAYNYTQFYATSL